MAERREERTEAMDLYRNAIVIDGLNPSRWGSETVFRTLRDGGVTAVNATIAIWDGFESTLDHIADWLGWFERYGELIRPVHAVSDILAAKQEGRSGVILGWQNASPVENRLDRLLLFHRLGVRIIQLTYNERNLLGDGCYERTDVGLSRFGQDAVREMGRLGILIDLSHCGDLTTLEAIEFSERPVAITHANARSQHDHPRNKTDEAIRALVARGGVIGANAFPGFFPKGWEATLDDYLDAIDYLVQMVGIDHVAIGTDFSQEQPRAFWEWIFASQGTRPAAQLPPAPEPYRHLRGLSDAGELPNLAVGLLRRGYPPAGVQKVLGANWLRLLEEVWAGA